MGDAMLLIERSPGEIRAALLDDDTLIQVDHYRDHVPLLDGAVFNGRVRRVEPGINAAFIDLDGRRQGFLRARGVAGRPKDAAIGSLVHEGQALLVQVRGERPESGDKLARLVTLDAEAVDRLKARGAIFAAPSCVDPGPSGLVRILSEHATTPIRIVFSDGTLLREARRWFSDQGVDAELEYRAGGLFGPLGIEAAISAALTREVPLDGGGSLIIEPGETLCAIDVNSGDRDGRAGRTGRDTNLAAVPEVARQLRLREIGGAIVVDFLDMDGTGDRDLLLAALREAVAGDPAPCQVLGYTRLGMVEMTRQRRRPSLAARMLEPAPAPQPSPDAAACALLRDLAERSRCGVGRFTVRAAPVVIALLEGAMAKALGESVSWSNARVDLSLDPSLPVGRYVIEESAPQR